jgi:DNA-binding SARP family transcriptional activator/tetratricopeptide (TPR) repeat protein
MRFAVLGPLGVTDGTGQQVELAGPRQRVLLAALLLHANVPVRAEELAETVWDGSPPPAAVTTLRSYIRRLRHALGAEGVRRITARYPGYLICVQEPELDVLEFQALCQTAGTALRSGDWASTSASAARALKLWRARPLLDVPSQMLADAFVPELERLRLQVLEHCFEARLHLGEHQELTGELRELTAQHPLRERFHAQLMLALAGTGRQAEALEVYAEARQLLVSELGIEPGPELRDLHQQILAGNIPLVTAHLRLPARAPYPPPRQLPAAVGHFTGRQDELTTLAGLLGQAGAGTVVISAINGMAGIGKTALAVHWAHQAAGSFPDGQLYVNLRGFGPSAPMSPAEAVSGFLAALGVPPERWPPGFDAQVGLYRSVAAGRRLLIVLDNATDAEQVRPLLPGSPGCLVLVTSRASLAGLAVSDGAHPLTLDVLPDDEARELLDRRIGSARAAGEPDAVSELIRLCAGLPLALAIVAARASARPGFALADLAAELRDESGRLDALDAGDPASSIRAVLSWSNLSLSEQAARMFRLLGLHPGPDISVPAAASLAGAGEAGARCQLHQLARAHLITEHVPGRYALHDLLRAYAAEKAHTGSQADRDAAIGRVLDYYLHTAACAARLLNPAKEPVVLAPPRPGAAAGQPADHTQALAWFEAEHQVLLAAVDLAVRSGFDGHAWQLPWAITSFLQARGHWQEWAATQRTALAAATHLGDTAAQALSRRLLANACTNLGDHDQARGHYASSLMLYQRLDNRLGEAKIHQSLCLIAEHQGRYADALEHAEQALRLYQAVGDRAGHAGALNAVGWHHALLGDYRQARVFCLQALTLCAEVGYRYVEGFAWDSLGYVEHHLGNFGEAAACYQRALTRHREAGVRFDEADTLIHLGDTFHAADELTQARAAWRQALGILDDMQHPDAEQVRAKLKSQS